LLVSARAIAVHPAGALAGVWAHATPLVRLASDHRPVCAALHPAVAAAHARSG
jgi:hypothetical protein